VRITRTGFVLAIMLTGCSNETPAPDPHVTPTQSATSVPHASDSGCQSETNGYCFGFGTYYVASRREIPRNWGNARSWYTSAQRDGYEVGDTPKKGAIAWTDRGTYGQVAIVEEVLDDGINVRISEMHGQDGGWNRVTTRITTASSFKYIY
jgi:surface antigen